MKIVLLAGASTIHTVRWANGLVAAGHEIHLISQHPVVDILHPSVQVYLFPYRGVLGYFTMIPGVNSLLKKIKPDLVNAHYASGYGTTAHLINFHPWILSVWGSDVYDVPYQSIFHKYLVRKNLLSADSVASTSLCMARQVRQLAPLVGEIAITPFGVDMSLYKNIQPESPVQKDTLVIGTVKTMSKNYGIDTLIIAFSSLIEKMKYNPRYPVHNFRLRLVGGGDQLPALKNLAQKIGVKDRIDFVGRVPHGRVPDELRKIDIYVALSRSESFGVAIVEASAAGRPVVVSDVGGLPEVTVEGVTGLVVPRENPAAAAAALEKLVLDPALRYRMGQAGKQHVSQKYDWETCVDTMVKVYRKTLETFDGRK